MTFGLGSGIEMVRSASQFKLTQEIGGQIGSMGRGLVTLYFPEPCRMRYDGVGGLGVDF